MTRRDTLLKMSRATLTTLAKFLVSGTLLAYLIARADLGTIWEAVRDADWLLVAGGFLLFYMHFLIGALRWRLIARLHGAEAPVSFFFVSYIVANFFARSRCFCRDGFDRPKK